MASCIKYKPAYLHSCDTNKYAVPLDRRKKTPEKSSTLPASLNKHFIFLKKLHSGYLKSIRVLSNVRHVCGSRDVDIQSLYKALKIFDRICCGKSTVQISDRGILSREKIKQILMHLLLRHTGRSLVGQLMDQNRNIQIQTGDVSQFEHHRKKSYSIVRINISESINALKVDQSARLKIEYFNMEEILGHELIHALHYTTGLEKELRRMPLSCMEESRWTTCREIAAMRGIDALTPRTNRGKPITEHQLSKEFGYNKRVTHLHFPDKYRQYFEGNKKQQGPLTCATACQEVWHMNALISLGEDVHASDYKGRTALHFAAAKGSKEVIGILMAEGARLDDQCHRGNTPIGFALLNRNFEALDILLTDVNSVDHIGDIEIAPLHFFADKGSQEGVSYMLERGADVLLRGYKGMLSSECAAANKHTEIAEELCKKELEKACALGDIAELLSHPRLNEFVNVPFIKLEEREVTLLQYAWYQGQSSLCRALIEGGISSLFAIDSTGNSLLMRLHNSKDYRASSYLLDILSSYTLAKCMSRQLHISSLRTR